MGCILLVFVYLLIQNGIIKEILRRRGSAFRSIMKNASQTDYPCQRKFWNAIYMMSGFALESPVEKNKSGMEKALFHLGMINRTNTKLSIKPMDSTQRDHNNYTIDAKKNVKIDSENEPSKIFQTNPTKGAPIGFEEALRKAADPNTGEVVLSLVDKTYADFALNFYETSVVRFGINNFLLVCVDYDAQIRLKSYNLSCFHYDISDYTKGADIQQGDFGTAGYYLKTNIKTLIVLQAIKLSYTILIVDLDIVFLKNPFPYFSCHDCDIHIQQDRIHLNSGFVYVRPTNRSIALYETAWERYNHYKKSHDQAYINMAVHILKQDGKHIKILKLSHQEFPCGAYYFTTPTTVRVFGNDRCKECVIVHNNYIGSTAAKRYRFRENLMWMVDSEGYYSNPQTKYITYQNSHYFGHDTLRKEKDALRSALAISIITNRVLILPKFHCCDCQRRHCEAARHKCSLLSVLKLRTFDEAFNGWYREHMFVQHPKVPPALRTLLYDTNKSLFLIKSETYRNISHSVIKERVLLPSNRSSGARESEIREWFKDNYEPVINFHSLYDAFGLFSNVSQNSGFSQKIDHAFTCTTVDQWENKPWI